MVDGSSVGAFPMEAIFLSDSRSSRSLIGFFQPAGIALCEEFLKRFACIVNECVRLV